MTLRAAIYARTSPDCPVSADEQIERLHAIARERGWTVVRVFTDRPTSVRKGVDKRPGEMALIDAIRSGTIDRVLAEGTGEFIVAPYQFAALAGVCHYAADQVPEKVNALLLAHLAHHPV